MAKLTYGLGVLMSHEAFEAEAQALPESWEVEAKARSPVNDKAENVPIPEQAPPPLEKAGG